MERKPIYHKSSSASLPNNPSFSSSLLDSIYRSIDEEKGGVKVAGDIVSYKGLTLTMRKNRTGCPFRGDGEEEEEVKVTDFRRDKRRSSDKVAIMGRKSSSAVLSSSSSSSSESSFWSGALSSSESDSFYGPKSTSSSSSSSSCYSMQRPKSIRTEKSSNASSSQKSKKHRDHEEVLATTKLKALKIYAELKKAKSKQPISPGGRVASFLNSLFANTKKKPKIVSEPSGEACDEGSKVKYSKSRSTPASCPSSASSYTRSCLSKTLSTSSGGKPINNVGKRSVRFDPVSVIVNEDSKPCGHKNLQEEDVLKIHVIEENRRVAEAARKLLESYRRTKASYNDPKGRNDDPSADEDTDIDDVDDGESCSSSDLFELDNLSSIGIERYREELPVYETTHVGTNRAIASGLIP